MAGTFVEFYGPDVVNVPLDNRAGAKRPQDRIDLADAHAPSAPSWTSTSPASQLGRRDESSAESFPDVPLDQRTTA